MTLSPGSRLGVYEVLSPIGAGGMGEVYRAKDPRLGREVAVKVLPEEFFEGEERRQRFEREARLLAALNHPGIAAIYSFEEVPSSPPSSSSRHVLVMELVEGEDLAQRISSGPLPLEETLSFAKQIAEALEAAHEKGIVHRDLKPANVKVTPDGRVKLLDFGLAKIFEGDGGPGSSPAVTASPTLTARATAAGVILGTAAYMSPEQARGKPLDKRTDVWAFGCVLYEMLTGTRAFAGETVSDTLAAVLTKEPDWSALPQQTPGKIRDLLRKCLRREAKQRLHDIADARLELEELSATSGTGTFTFEESPAFPGPASARSAPAVSARGSRKILWIACGISAALAAAAGWFARPTAPAPQHVSRTMIALPPGHRLAGLDRPALALSPDGSLLAYVAIQGGTQQIYLRSLDRLEARPVAGTEGAVCPFFSPDGKWLGFFAGRKLRRIPVSGGAVVTLGDAPDPEGASWSRLGTIAFAPSTVSALQQLPDGGGTQHQLTRLEKGEATHRWPFFLPDGKAVLFAYGTTAGNWENQQIAVQSVGTGGRRNLFQQGMSPTFVPSGYLIYAQRGSLMAMPFDPRRLAVTGTAVPVVEGVLQASTGASQYSISESGSLAYVPGGFQSAQLSLVWVTRSGVEQPVAAPARGYSYPRLSPDGRRLAVGVADTGTQLWLYEFARETLTRLTLQGGLSALPAWTPDGKRVAFTSRTDGPLNLFWQLADGSGGPERLTTSENNHTPMSWSPDGKELVFGEVTPETGFDILVLRTGDQTARPLLRTPFNESTPRLSPDGRWLAYASDESGQQEIYVQPFPGPGGKWPISAEGGREPVWNPSGRELFYRSGDRMMAVGVTTEPGFVAGKPRILFEGSYEPTVFTVANYDVAPDGQRFLMLKRTDPGVAASTQITLVLNWLEELKTKAGRP